MYDATDIASIGSSHRVQSRKDRMGDGGTPVSLADLKALASLAGSFGVRGQDRAFPGRDMSRPPSGVMPPHSKSGP